MAIWKRRAQEKDAASEKHIKEDEANVKNISADKTNGNEKQIKIRKFEEDPNIAKITSKKTSSPRPSQQLQKKEQVKEKDASTGKGLTGILGGLLGKKGK